MEHVWCSQETHLDGPANAVGVLLGHTGIQVLVGTKQTVL